MKNHTSQLIALSLVLIIPICFLSCKKDKETDEEKIGLNVTPGETFLTATPGEYKTFNISGSSPSKLSRLKITYKREGGALSTLVDSLLETNKIDYSFPFQIPLYGSQNIYLNIYFEITNTEGETATVAKGINVLFNNYPLSEIVDNELYSRLSGQPSAYNLRSESAISYLDPATEDMNITDSVQVDSLSLTWISPAGGQFVRKNTFDYNNATLADLKNSFESSAKTTKLVNLMIGDIILYKQTYGIEVFYAAVKITDIQNNAGSNNDKYIFNIKK